MHPLCTHAKLSLPYANMAPQVMAISRSHPLYVASHWPDVDPARNATLLTALAKANFTLVTSHQLLPRLAERLGHRGWGRGLGGGHGWSLAWGGRSGGGDGGFGAMQREQMAMLDYYIALGAHQFIGEWCGARLARGLVLLFWAWIWMGDHPPCQSG